jgi:hypothetical protein
MPNYEFECCCCEHRFVRLLLLSELAEAQVEKNDFYDVQCPECRQSLVKQHYGTDRNFINTQNGEMYGTSHHGKYHPGLGEMVTSYDHKNRLLKEQGVREAADPIKGSRTILGDSQTLEQHFDAPDAKEHEKKDKKKRSDQIKKDGFTWA